MGNFYSESGLEASSSNYWNSKHQNAQLWISIFYLTLYSLQIVIFGKAAADNDPVVVTTWKSSIQWKKGSWMDS